MVDLATAKYRGCREWSAPGDLTLSEDFGLLLHLSWVRPIEDLKFKLATWGHRTEVRPGFLTDVLLASVTNPLLRHVHPTHPPAYDHIERISKPRELSDAWDGNPVHGEPALDAPPPKTHVVVAYHGGDDVFELLDSLSPLTRRPKPKGPKARSGYVEKGPVPLFEGVVLVDDPSPDSKVEEIIKRYPWVTVVKCSQNVGFAQANNIGVKNVPKNTEAVFLVNSDCAVCRSGILPMYNTYNSSSSIGIVGVMTNEAGYGQKIDVTPSQLENLEGLCRDLAARNAQDEERCMIVDFAMLVRKSVWDAVGGMDPNYFPAMWEDTALCYEVARIRSRCVLSVKAFVAHKCSRTIRRRKESPASMLARGAAYFHRKYGEDVDSGFASHLPGGMDVSPVRFDWTKAPEVLRQEIRRLAPAANIGLSMICSNHESIIEDLCRSIEGLFTQKVVYLNDCTDGSKAILLKHGFEILEGPFIDFSDARNRALVPMTTPWIMFLDTDDWISATSGLLALRAVLVAGPEVGGFMVPTQFPPGKGNTRVDRVCVVRRHGGTSFIFPIHENVVQSVPPDQIVVGIPGAQVVHLNYGSSPDEQKAKRIRDWPLLEKGVKLYPECPFNAWCMGMTLEDDQQFDEAIVWLDRSISLSTPKTSTLRKAYYVRARAYLRKGSAAQAEAAARGGLAIYPDDPELNLFMADICERTGRAAEALECIERMKLDTSGHFGSIDVGVLGPKRLFMRARALLGLGRYIESVEDLRESAAQGQSAAAVLLGEAAANRRDFAIAEEALGLLLRLEGHSELWCALRVRVSEMAGIDPEGHLWALVRGRTDEPGAFLVLARRLLARGLEHPAIPLLQALSEMGIWEGAQTLGTIYVRHRQLRRALACFGRALELNPGNELSKSQYDGVERAIADGMPGAEEEVDDEVEAE
jgi:GT2 family glycosyltransferase/tetratricopeptide (TPR) repeat protein